MRRVGTFWGARVPSDIRLHGPIALSILLWAAGAGPGLAQVRSDPGPARFEHVLTIGALDGPTEYLFSAPVGVAVSQRGEIIVLDARDRDLRVFDAQGRFLRRMGRAGSGPGEFTNPLALSVSDTIIKVVDLNGRLTAFSVSGRYLWDRVLPELGGLSARMMVRLRHDYWLAARAGMYSNIGADDREILLLLRENGQVMDTVSAHATGSVLYSRPAFPMLAPAAMPVGAGVVWAVGGDSLVVLVDSYSGMVRWFEVQPRGLVQIASRSSGLSGAALTAADRERIRAAVRSRYSAFPDIRVVIPDRFGAASAALLDERGRVWINTRERGDRTQHWVIVPPEPNVPVQRVTVPDGFRPQTIRRDRLYGTARGDFEVPLIRVLRIR
jgi:hypothetical protein